jgi:proteasome regulatory subunit
MAGKNTATKEDSPYQYVPDTEQIELENRILKETVQQLQREVERLHEPALMVCEVSELVDGGAIIRVQNGNQFFVSVSSTAKNIKPGDTVLCEQKNLTVIRKTGQYKQFDVEKFVIIEKPQISWKEIGGLAEQIREIREVIEMPLKNPEIFKKIGIEPPKGVLLYGPPGTGKTLLGKAVAAETNSTFIEIVGSELVQKFIGEGAKQIKEIFNLAREKAPAVIFIDEIDSIAAKRIEIGTSGEREVQRTFMQLLSEVDGFDTLGNVKIIGCTNRIDILDPAITRPGRLDRLIEVQAPDIAGIEQIFNIHTRNMTLDAKTKKQIVVLAKKMEGFSGAEIKAVCTEAGYFAIRKNKTKTEFDDFIKAIAKVKKEEKDPIKFKHMFG